MEAGTGGRWCISLIPAPTHAASTGCWWSGRNSHRNRPRHGTAAGIVPVLVLVLGTTGTAGSAGSAGTTDRKGKRLLARRSVDEQTLVPPSRTPGTAAYTLVGAPRVAHYGRKRFCAYPEPRYLSRRLRRKPSAARSPQQSRLSPGRVPPSGGGSASAPVPMTLFPAGKGLRAKPLTRRYKQA